MNQLQIDLGEGFSSDEVKIEVDGESAFSQSNISTRMQIGLAEQVQVDLGDRESAVVRVEIPNRGLSQQTEVRVAEGLHLGVSIGRNGQLLLKQSAEPFRYM